MSTEQDMFFATVITSILGKHGAQIAAIEPQIDQCIKLIQARREEDPDNIAIPIMMNLLVAAKELIAAHRVIERVSEMMTSGTMQHEGTERLQ